MPKKNSKIYDSQKDINFWDSNYIGNSKAQFKKDKDKFLPLWGGLVSSYAQPNKPAVIVNERPFASMFNEKTNNNIFRPLIPVPKKTISNKTLRGYNFNLGPASNPLVIKSADSRFGGPDKKMFLNNNIGNSGVFRLHNEDPFGNGVDNLNVSSPWEMKLARAKIARIKAARNSNKMKDIRWIDMVGNAKYKKYTTNPFGDTDKDGLLNIFDCRPGNKWYQGDPNLEFTPIDDDNKYKALREEASQALNQRAAKARKAKKIAVAGFETVFNKDGTPMKGKGGRPPKPDAQKMEESKDDIIKRLLKTEQKRIDAEKLAEYEKGVTKRKELSIEVKKEKLAKDLDAKELKEQGKAWDRYNEQEKIINKNKKLSNQEREILRKENKDKATRAQKNISNIFTKERLRLSGKKLSIQETKERQKLAKLLKAAESKKRGRQVAGSTESLYATAGELQAKSREAGLEARDLTEKIWGEKYVDPKTGKTVYVKGKEGEVELLKRKQKMEKGLANAIAKGYDQDTITKWKDKLALYEQVTDQSVKNLQIKRQEERDKQAMQAARAKTIGKIYETKKGFSESVYGGLGTVFRTDKAKVQRVFEDAAGMAKAAKKKVKTAFSHLGKRDTAMSKVYTQRGQRLLGALTSFGGIGGVGGNMMSGYGARGAIGESREAYYEPGSMSESEYAKVAGSVSGATQYTDSGLFPSEGAGAGRPEGSYKYGMPIHEYKAMKREQEQAMRLKQAFQEQAWTKQLTTEAQMAMGGVGGARAGVPAGFAQTMTTASITPEAISGDMSMITPQAAGAMAVPGITIGAGMDVVSGVMNMGRKPHSSQVIFPGLHAEARTAKIPWLPTDPAMIRDPERLPVYFPDQPSAEYARNTQTYNVTSLPRGSPLVGPVGYQYAARIKEIKAPQTKNMIMQTQNDGIVKMNPTMKANPWGLMLKNRFNFSESNIVDEDLRGNVVSRDQIGGNIINAPNIFAGTGDRVTDLTGTRNLNPGIVGSGNSTVPFGNNAGVWDGRIRTFTPEVTGYTTNGIYAAQKSGQVAYPSQTGVGDATIPYNYNLGVWDGKIKTFTPEITGLGAAYAAQQTGEISYDMPLSGNPAVASANPYKGMPEERQVMMMEQKRTQERQGKAIMSKKQQMDFARAREVAIQEQERLKGEEEYVKQVAIQEGLKETDALGGKGFAKPVPMFNTIKEMVLRKGPSDVEKQISVLAARHGELANEAAKEVEDIHPGSPLPLNMMSNAKGNFEDLPVVLKQQVIEEEIYRKQNEEMQNRYNTEQSKYQADLKEQMRQAAAIRNAQMDAAKKAQMAAEQMLAAKGSDNKESFQSSLTTQDIINQPVQYATGEILDPYYDEYAQQMITQTGEQNQPQEQQGNPNGYNAIKKKASRSQNNLDVEVDNTHYTGVVPTNINRTSSPVPGGSTYGSS